MSQESNHKPSLKEQMYIIIFEADTPMGKRFDVLILWAIVLSVLAVILESVQSLQKDYRAWFVLVEWILTVLFSIEYVLRIYSARNRLGYVKSFFGVIDFLSVIPTYIALFMVDSGFLSIVRIFRLMRVFRVLKLVRYMREADILWNSLKASRAKVAVFLFGVVNVAIFMGTLMYIIEGGENGFTSIPRSIYWAIVTMTTVGFGDISPATNLGQFVASVLMVLGYGIIAIPTGLVGMEINKQASSSHPHTHAFQPSDRMCGNCGKVGHNHDADYCMMCGSEL